MMREGMEFMDVTEGYDDNVCWILCVSIVGLWENFGEVR